MSSADEESQHRQWQWIFRALWSAAPKSGDVAHSARRTRCHLHLLVPDTILFQRGEPCKWLGNSPEGIVVRKPFCGANGSGESVSANTASTADAPSELRHEALATRVAARRQAPPSSRRMDDFEVVERLDTVIAAFVAFAAAGSSLSSSLSSSSTGSDAETDVPVCVARYNDGSTELLSSKSLQTLGRFYNWRTSVCALQAYVRPAQGKTANTIGTYDRRHARRGRARRHHRPGSPTSPKVGSVARSYSDHWNSSRDLTGENDPSTLDSAADDASSSSRPLGASTAMLDQAAKDVAFVTDMSYAWPPEPSRTTPRFGGDKATAANSNIPRDPEDPGASVNQGNAMDTDIVLPGSRPVVVVGERAGQSRGPAPPWPRSRVRVSRLDAEFVIDQNGRPWLTNAPKVCFTELVYQYRVGGVIRTRHSNDSLT